MKFKYTLLLLLWSLNIAAPFGLKAQSTSVAAYTAVASTSVYQSINTTTAHPAPDNGNYDEGWFNNKPIGFTFRFRGTDYTTFSASTNGWLTLGQGLSSAMKDNGLAAAAAGFPIIAPLWDDLSLESGKNGFYYETTGTAPNRVLTAEWYNASWGANAKQSGISFEVKLYENTNVVQFAYSQVGSKNNLDNPSASIGLVGAPGEFISVAGLNTTPTFSTSKATNNIDTKPNDGQAITFTPARVTYDFAAKNIPYEALTSQPAIRSGGNSDDGYYNGIPIGFSFQFRGVAYNTISASTNGWLTFNQDLTDSGFLNNIGGYASGIALPTVLAPLWDDLSLGEGGFRTSTTGTTPNRIFTAEWYNVRWIYSAVAYSLSFKVQLFEGSNRVWYSYSAPSATTLSSPSASIGLNDGGDFLSLNNTGAAPIASTTVATDNLATRPAGGQVYAFAPTAQVGGPLPVELLDFTAIRNTPSTVSLAWHTASERNNKGFAVEKSGDGQTFQQVAFVVGAGNSSQLRSYSFADANSSAAYYRLLQQDIDGAISYSPIHFVPAHKSSVPALLTFPNPAHSKVQVLGLNPSLPLTLSNGLGQLIRVFSATSDGTLNLEGIAPGVYWLQANGRTSRLVVE